MIRKIILSLLLLALVNPVRSQISTVYNQGYLRDIITSDSSIFTVHFNPSQDTLDYTNTKDKLILYKFDLNLNLVDSIILDSLRIGKCIERNGNIYIAATRCYPDTFTCSMNLYHLNENLDILNYREFKETDVSFFASDFNFIGDSLRILIGEDRAMDMGIQYSKEYFIDTAFVNLDSISCGIPQGFMVFYYKNSIAINGKRIYSGSLDLSNFHPPIYHIFSDDGTCNNLTPFSSWQNYILNETNFFLMKGYSNFLLKDNYSFFITITGEENFGSFDSFSGVLKMDSLFNPIDYYIHQPTALEEDLVPFRNKGIIHFDDKIVLASNTKMESHHIDGPTENNEIHIELLDTNLNYISSINIDPLPGIDYTYYGDMLELLPDGGILLGGGFASLNGLDPSSVFLIKYSSLSELLGVSEENSEWNSLNLYPNPANDILKIESNILFENAEVKFYDVTGKVMMSKEFNENGFSVEDFSKGIYFIQINTEKGNFSGKFVKE
jgi:hypothetical protein